MASTAKGKKKSKGKTLNLNEFLADEKGSGPGTSYVLANKPVSWADEMENEETEDSFEPYGSRDLVNRAVLPTAPRAARGPDVDMEKIPTAPPFTAFLGNIPYDVNEEEITRFFRGLSVVNVRIPTERKKGFCYAEFEDRQSLIDALSLNDGLLRNRKIRIDLADQHEKDGGSRMNDRRMGGDRDRDGGEDKTLGDWRSGGGGGGGGSRGGDDYDRGYGGRDRGYGGDREGYGNRDQGSRGYSRYGDRDRGYGGDQDRGYGGDRYGGDRDRGYGDRDRYGGDRYDRRGGGGYGDRDRDRDYGGNRRAFGSGYRGNDRDDGYGGGGRYGSRDRYYGDRYNDRDNRDGGSRFASRDIRYYGDNASRDGPPRDGPPRDGPPRDDGPSERPRLKLQPRTKPIEDVEQEQNHDSHTDRPRDQGPRDHGPRDQGPRDHGPRDHGPRDHGPRDGPTERPRLKLQPRSKPLEESGQNTERVSSIFGNAKPVDTATREREIERRLIEQKKTDVDKLEHEKENRVRLSSSTSDKSGRPRQDSEHSADGSERHTRRERKSSSSSGKGIRTVAPPPGVGSARVRRDSALSDEQEVFDEDSSPKQPSHKASARKGDKQATHQEEPAKLVPAPPPKENIWEKRKKEIQPTSPPQKNEVDNRPKQQPPQQQNKPSQQQKSPQTKTESHSVKGQSSPQQPSQTKSAPPPKVNAWSKGKPDLKPADPPKENVWAKRKQEQELKTKQPERPRETKGTSTSQDQILRTESESQTEEKFDEEEEKEVLTAVENESPIENEKGGAKSISYADRIKSGNDRTVDKNATSADAPKSKERPKGKAVVVSAKTEEPESGFSGSHWGNKKRGEGAPRGRGESGRGRGGRGRGAERSNKARFGGNREKQLPRSIDEMPKYEEVKAKDFSDSNKYAGLLDQDDESDHSDE